MGFHPGTGLPNLSVPGSVAPSTTQSAGGASAPQPTPNAVAQAGPGNASQAHVPPGGPVEGAGAMQPPPGMQQPPTNPSGFQPQGMVPPGPAGPGAPVRAPGMPPMQPGKPEPATAWGAPPGSVPNAMHGAPYAPQPPAPQPYGQQLYAPLPSGPGGLGWNAPGAPPAPPAGYGYPFGYAPGARVQVTWSNGQRYPATVSQVSGAQCLVVFPDGQQHWVEMQYLSPA
jgi:hypothetical protein